MTDPTTRDPAASLARYQSLIQAAGERCASGFAWGKSHALGVAAAAAIEFVSDAAPALLARIAELEAENLTTWQDNMRIKKGVIPMLQRAEAAEQVAREAVVLLRAVIPVLEPGELNADVIRGCIDTFLAHHGARTGESNESAA